MSNIKTQMIEQDGVLIEVTAFTGIVPVNRKWGQYHSKIKNTRHQAGDLKYGLEYKDNYPVKALKEELKEITEMIPRNLRGQFLSELPVELRS